MRILIAEDEKKLAGFIQQGLIQAGYLTEVCHDGSEALEMAVKNEFDLILLDLMLPGINGFDFLKNLRTFGAETPVIIISAIADSRQVVQGLDLGAVDYIRKPFEWDELLARIRIVSRFSGSGGQQKIRIEDLEIDIPSRKVKRGTVEIELTSKEFVLLEYLMRNANLVLTKNQLLENAWNMNFDPESNIVEVYMHQLRKKIDKGFDRQLIKTVIGAGYMLKGEKQ
ncbi:response regulator transcription factor [Chryseobacterium hagamense]|uniref:DNA-binding response regulator n=1 Tax=Chryseobacterium hagamense TaxID=395935 RepID=A0A511YS39_9FLAO|nr:response regulator transcription factor [Chryseobacterium hagamense]GEN78014.1 DNA-binding response regulator [Chryseobacterium hagamense]